MTWIDIVALAASVEILVCYGVMVLRPERAGWFDWANAVGCFPIIASEIVVGAWAPLVLTVAFGVIGWVGVIRSRVGRPLSEERLADVHRELERLT